MPNSEQISATPRSRPMTDFNVSQLPDSTLLEIINRANREVHRRGIAAEKPFNPLRILNELTGETGQLNLAQVLMMVMVNPSKLGQLEKTVVQALLEGCQLVGQATTLVEKTRRRVETIVRQNPSQN